MFIAYYEKNAYRHALSILKISLGQITPIASELHVSLKLIVLSIRHLQKSRQEYIDCFQDTILHEYMLINQIFLLW